MIPGEYFLKDTPIECNKGKKTVTLKVVNTGDRPVQIGSHFHFFEVNEKLDFDREKTRGMRLNILAGTAVRFEPSEAKEVQLISFGGKMLIHGFNVKTNGIVNKKNNKN